MLDALRSREGVDHRCQTGGEIEDPRLPALVDFKIALPLFSG